MIGDVTAMLVIQVIHVMKVTMTLTRYKGVKSILFRGALSIFDQLVFSLRTARDKLPEFFTCLDQRNTQTRVF